MEYGGTALFTPFPLSRASMAYRSSSLGNSKNFTAGAKELLFLLAVSFLRSFQKLGLISSLLPISTMKQDSASFPALSARVS